MKHTNVYKQQSPDFNKNGLCCCELVCCNIGRFARLRQFFL